MSFEPHVFVRAPILQSKIVCNALYYRKFRELSYNIKNLNQNFVHSRTATNSKFRHNYILMKLTTIVDDFPKNIKRKKPT